MTGWEQMTVLLAAVVAWVAVQLTRLLTAAAARKRAAKVAKP